MSRRRWPVLLPVLLVPVIGVLQGWAVAAWLSPLLLVPLVARRLAGDVDPLAGLKKTFPFKKYVMTWGPLNWEKWVRRLDGDKDAWSRLRARVGGTDPGSGLAFTKAHWKRLIPFIREHPPLKRRVEREYQLQLASMERALRFSRALRAPAVKSEEWRVLYGRILARLEKHGTNDAFGKGGFFLVDDEVGEPGHKLEILQPEALTRDLLRDLQDCLAGLQNEWYVILTLHFDRVNPDLDPGMIAVWKDRIDEAIDREQLKRALGPRFRL
jgi:hypothetical protein